MCQTSDIILRGSCKKEMCTWCFDRYYEYSTKGVTRSARNTEASRVHQLKLQRSCITESILTVTENKKQLIDIIRTELKGDCLAAKTGKGYTSTPKLDSLPPTSEAFEENVKRAHHQASIWRAVKDADPPERALKNMDGRR
ncbi:hypothetical protein GWK47_031207 [Chionoecetes opilio]|uniref:Uncharacterized protein n=1 Tax=Chionoecetes opilio TaxID=41210 RepID=A0A8J4YV89_CHIOP|nr:hypothetical protein GWK47_031207 [Chionoecetes opilio]